MKILLITLFLILLYILYYYYNIPRYANININPYSYLCLDYKNIPRVHSNERVVISLTTTPDGINNSIYTFASILSQTRRVDQIRINIPLYSAKKENKYIIPIWMKRLERDIDEFVIKRYNYDQGPIMKMLPTVLEEEGNVKIVYIDDDMIYHQKFIQHIVKYSNLYPQNTICTSGFTDNRGECIVCKKVFNYIIIQPSKVQIAHGFGGVLVKPKFFDKEKLVDFKSYPNERFFVDDIYISGILNNGSVTGLCTWQQRSICHLQEFIYGFILRNTNRLSSTHNKNEQNNIIVSKCFKWMNK